ncbi:MAG: iron-containing alcohol dehydrogenase, partial [Paracoccaceae bacterium]
MTDTQRTIRDAVTHSSSVAEVLVGRGVLTQTGSLFLRQFGPGPACLIADENTWVAAGPAVQTALVAAGVQTRRHILPATPRPKPTVELATTLRHILEQDAATPVAIGSGVINDIVKHAAFALDRPYLCIATAASMDDYTSAGSPLSDKG